MNYTEQPTDNNLDRCSPEGIVDVLREANEEMLRGLQQDWVYDRIERFASILRDDPNCLLVLSGCGTSGRIAHFCCRAWSHPRVKYCIAGGDAALTSPVENAEDDPHAGQRDLEATLASAPTFKRALLVGITCGLSAPYVAGQLHWALQRPQQMRCCLLGFNPVSASRNVPIEKWDLTFRQVAQMMSEQDVLNPVVGPEPVAGSTRMKGGSATKILLECIWRRSLSSAAISVAEMMHRYAHACRYAYDAAGDRRKRLGMLMQKAAEALRRDRGVVYTGSSDADTPLLWRTLAAIDASECPPTFGASATDFRAQQKGQQVDVRDGDVVIVLDKDLPLDDATEALEREGDNGRNVEIAVKLQLNAVSTGAFVLFGKVYGNRMIDVRLSNNKLYFRAIAIVADIAPCDKETAKRCVWKAVYRSDHPNVTDDTPISQHVQQAALVNRVVPISIVLARNPGMTIEEAIRTPLKR